jgi:hypothetical protein
LRKAVGNYTACLLLLLLLFQASPAQTVQSVVNSDKTFREKSSTGSSDLTEIDEGISISQADTIPADAESLGLPVRGVCKGYKIFHFVFNDGGMPVKTLPAKAIASLPNVSETKYPLLLKVTGNILYDVNYRSRVDTPYAENDIYQHTLQTRLNFTYKDQYPFRVYLTTRFSNSNLFRKYTDLDFHYHQPDFARLLKKRLIDAVANYLVSKTTSLDSLRKQIELQKNAIASLNKSVLNRDITQKTVEARERLFYGNRSHGPVINRGIDAGDIKKYFSTCARYKFPDASLKTNNKAPAEDSDSMMLQRYYAYRDSFESKQRIRDSMGQRLEQLENLYHEGQSIVETEHAEWKKSVEEAKDTKALEQLLHKFNMPDTVLPKGYRTLFALQSVSIGRSVANYSELSVKNISITGLQVEYNPGYYYAVAAGKVDYRFRDYLVPNQVRPNQYLGLVRFGKGMKNGNHVIFSYYTGKRQLFNAAVSSQAVTVVPGYHLAGFTIEGWYKVNRNISLTAEIAKSTAPYYSLDSIQRKNWMGSVTRFSDRSNEAYSVKMYAYFPQTQTRFTGSAQYIGANFQSFSTFTTGTAQTKWMARLEQPFFKKQLNVVSSLQQNDYTNPFVATAYKSAALLASIQATLRIKKWPVLSAGYYPSYQLTKINDNSYSESRYYTMVGNASYYYHIESVQLTTYAVYSRFYNQAADSGFVYFNSQNLLLSQNITAGRLSIMLNWSESLNTDYSIYTIENNNQVEINRIISVGAGIKMVRQTLLYHLQWGYSGNLSLRIPKFGDIQLTMDKGYMPGLNRQLVDSKFGRLTYYKTF